MPNENLKIDLIDDDEMHLDMLKNHLDKELNANFSSFTSGEDFLQEMNGQPDIVVLDYNLDSENKNAATGLDVLQEIKNRYKKTQVIILSGQDNLNVAVDMMRYGAYDYVVKNESGFIRTENCIKNIIRQQNRENALRSSNRAAWFMVAVFALIILVSLIIYIFFPELIPERATQMGLS